MSVSLVTIPRVLREKLGEDGAEALVDFLNAGRFVQESALGGFADRIERRFAEIAAGLKSDMSALEGRLRGFTLTVVGVGVAFLSLLVVWVR